MRKRRGRHEGTVYRRADGRWEARKDIGIDSNGRRRQVSAYGATKQDALEKLATKLSRPSISTNMASQLLCEFLADYLNDVKLKNRLNTYKLRTATIDKHINPWIGGVSMARLETKHIRNLLLELKRSGRSDHTIRRTYLTLHAAFEPAVQRGDLTRNPCHGCPVPKARPKPRNVLDLEQVHLFLAAARKYSPHFALYVLGCTTAMRQGEILALQREDVNLEKGWLDVRYTLTEDEGGRLGLSEPKTKKSIRRIYLCRLAIDALREHLREGPRSGFVFTAGGRPIWKRNFAQRDFRPLLERAGVNRITFHELRHTANSLLLSDGVSANVMAEMLGHESTRMTLDVYGHVIPGAQAAAVKKLDALFPGLEFDGQMMVNEAHIASDLPNENARKPLRRKHFGLVEMRGLEPRTPYMRSKCSTS